MSGAMEPNVVWRVKSMTLDRPWNPKYTIRPEFAAEIELEEVDPATWKASGAETTLSSKDAAFVHSLRLGHVYRVVFMPMDQPEQPIAYSPEATYRVRSCEEDEDERDE